eukprot:TRINITY_DN20553_c0_g1_i1.p1 TRINITY_DN20553_c0_g1~~TRINITY_DN20553_c0_g1_i1.p1  ORF type:complete len:253 (-),score=52.96 TRINITY_DN20553_c0_g1_i1:67-789(-)
MTLLTCPSCVILCLFVSGSWAQLRQKSQGYPDGPVAGGFVSPSDDYGDLLQRLENYEKPSLPHVAPVDDVYNQLDGSLYQKYNIEKQDDVEEGSGEEEEEEKDEEVGEDNYYLSIIVPSVAIGLLALIFSLTFGLSGISGRSDDSFLSFFPKPQVDNNIAIDDLFNLDKILGRFKRSASGDEDTDYVAYLLNSVEVISNLNGGIHSTSCELKNLATDPRFPTLSRIIAPFLSNSGSISDC